MPTIVVTKQGQTVDAICHEHYGRTAQVTETVLSANPGLAANGPVLPLGTRIVMPDIASRQAAPALPTLWD